MSEKGNIHDKVGSRRCNNSSLLLHGHLFKDLLHGGVGLFLRAQRPPRGGGDGQNRPQVKPEARPRLAGVSDLPQRPARERFQLHFRVLDA